MATYTFINGSKFINGRMEWNISDYHDTSVHKEVQEIIEATNLKNPSKGWIYAEVGLLLNHYPLIKPHLDFSKSKISLNSLINYGKILSKFNATGEMRPATFANAVEFVKNYEQTPNKRTQQEQEQERDTTSQDRMESRYKQNEQQFKDKIRELNQMLEESNARNIRYVQQINELTTQLNASRFRERMNSSNGKTLSDQDLRRLIQFIHPDKFDNDKKQKATELTQILNRLRG